jgi:branched-subunit amino acid ABC-type transport system permease component
MDIFLQQLINGLVLGSVYALVALGYTMVYGILELINFAHGEITMMGAMVIRNTRRIRILFASHHPLREVFLTAARALASP